MAGWPTHILEEQSLSKLLQHPGKETYGADRNLFQGQSFDLRASLWIDICSGKVKSDFKDWALVPLQRPTCFLQLMGDL